jgi:hypothetical protein
MALEFVDMLRPRDFYRENSAGYSTEFTFAPTGDVGGLPLPKFADQGYTAISNIPGSLTVSTGLTLKIALVDDGTSAHDLGKVVRVGITPRRVVSGADKLDLDADAATETTADVTLDATTGEVVIGTITIANAALDSTVVNNMFALRVRRIGSHANDTCQGRVVFLGLVVSNT